MTIRDRRRMARSLAMLFLVGGLFAEIALVLPRPPGSNEGGVLSVGLVALAGAVTLALIPAQYVARWLIHLGLGLGTTLISTAIYFWRPGEVASAVAMIYVWILLYAYYFFPAGPASAHAVLVGASYAVALSVQSGHDAVITQWMVTVGTALVAGVLIGRLVRQVYDLAATDPLTELANRRTFDEALESEMVRCRRTGSPLSVAIIDVDNFKEINDAGGHEAGDRVLISLAVAWQDHLRATDLLARYAGDEFAVLLRDCDETSGEASMARLMAATPRRPCTVGLARWDGTENVDQLMSRADQAMYRGKSAGRQRIMVAD